MFPIETTSTGKKDIGNRDLRIVTIGGGTGSSVLLRGLKKFTSNITAIVTVADDGGGSGILREDLGMLPPGDIRACLIALANTEPAMEKLMQYRFQQGSLEGQSFGNLFLAAMDGLYGSFEQGLKETAHVLAITGKVLPMTLENVVLYARLEDGSVIEGESNITFLTRKKGGRIKTVFIKPALPTPMPEAIEDILQADIIILGPGSLYTSIMPNLLVDDICQAIRQSKAKKYYVCNVMTQPGETDGYTPVDHVQAIIDHSPGKLFDTVVINNEEIPRLIREKYFRFKGSEPVFATPETRKILTEWGYHLLEGNFVDIKKDYIRHDAVAVGKEIIAHYKKTMGINE